MHCLQTILAAISQFNITSKHLKEQILHNSLSQIRLPATRKHKMISQHHSDCNCFNNHHKNCFFLRQILLLQVETCLSLNVFILMHLQLVLQRHPMNIRCTFGLPVLWSNLHHHFYVIHGVFLFLLLVYFSWNNRIIKIGRDVKYHPVQALSHHSQVRQ